MWFASSPSPEKRARGTPDAPIASAAPCAKVESTRVSSPRSHRTDPAFRARWASGLLRALPGGDSSALVRHRRSMLTSWLRLKRTATHRLDASDGHRDHTTWAGAQRQRGGVHLHPGRTAQRRRPREDDGSRHPRHGGDPPFRQTPAPNAAASTASRPADRDDRETPLSSGRDGLGILSYRNIVKISEACPGRGAARGSAAWCAAEPGPSRRSPLWRSRLCDAARR